MTDSDTTNTTPVTEPAPTPVAAPAASSAPAASAPAAPAPKPVPFTYDLERKLRPYQQWLVVLVVLTLGASCLLISARHGTKDGAVPWAPNSILRIVVEILNFNYACPTLRGDDVKWLAQGLGAAAALATAGFMLYVRSGRRREEEDWTGGSDVAQSQTSPRRRLSESITLVGAAQIAMLAFGVWAILSFQWAHWPPGALGEALRNMFVIVWAVALGRSMNRWSALRAGVGMALILAVTAVVGLWYYYERNPVLRLEFPIGNPIFFAACMLPAVIMAVAGMGWAIENVIRTGRAGGGTGPNPLPAASVRDRNAAAGQSRPLFIGIGSVVVLIVVGWAFVLTDSRGPLLALLVGLAAAGAALLIRWVPHDRRRLMVLGMIVLALAAVVFVARPWLQAQQTMEAGGRGATWRFRFYTWDYAKRLVLDHPLAGGGQGSYFCLSQQMACMPTEPGELPDVEKDPLVFASGMVGHAHNEWLEILADLGLIGFALMATALGLTFWAGWRTFMRADRPADKWYVLGLMAALLAIILEECADVALRMPVLPAIFYTVIGLLWAYSREPEPSTAPVYSRASWLGTVGMVAALLGAVFIASTVSRDWQRALAAGRVDDLLEKRQWDAALAQALEARRDRLMMENHALAGLKATQVAHAAAAHQHEQFRGMLARQTDPSNRARIRNIAEEDIARFDQYFAICMSVGTELWNTVPGVHSVADWMAQVLLMKHEIESLKPSIGMETRDEPLLPAARHWIQMSYLRNRFDTPVALQLLAMSGAAPMDQRLELLRVPLRMGPRPAGSLTAIERAVRQILDREPTSFDHYLETLLREAEAVERASTGPDAWSDPYAPESLRLKGLAEKIAGRYAQAAEYAGRAVKLYDHPAIRLYYPATLSHALGEQARWLFLAAPDAPQPAAELCRRALASWPAALPGDDAFQLLRRELSLYLLA
ncbi:MAG TPA: O-antigen ligase family protein, partial [Phycisphaerae bacterium]|nr:O-antigen ligase family protein [Phycisphaerae bacterium]